LHGSNLESLMSALGQKQTWRSETAINRERRQSRRLPVSLTPPAKEAAIC
jgi:hypothetical protein